MITGRYGQVVSGRNGRRGGRRGATGVSRVPRRSLGRTCAQQHMDRPEQRAILPAVVHPPLTQADVPPSPLPVVFGPPDRQLLGLCHAPAGPAKALGVVLCNPLGYEAMSAHRTYRHLAARLAARGFLSLRFDYDGTGDSAGTSHDPGRLRAWLDSIGAAVAEVRARTGSEQVALFGVRFGATLATVAAGELGGVSSLISWAPILSGRVHVRELQAYRLLKPGKGPKGRASDGSEEIAGHYFSAETLAAMSKVDLLTSVGAVAKRALVLHRNERATDEKAVLRPLEGRRDGREIVSRERLRADDARRSVLRRRCSRRRARSDRRVARLRGMLS